MYITSSGAENFGTLTAGANITISHIAVIANYGIAGQQLLVTKALAASREYVAGDELILPAGALDMNFPNGEMADAAVKEAWDGWLAAKTGGLTALLGTGAMGTAGTTNEVAAGRGYTRQKVEYTTGLGIAPA